MKSIPLGLLLAAILTFALLWAGRQKLPADTAAMAERPNIVLIITDDHRHDGAYALGTPDLITPHLDRLIRRGTTFTNTYIAGSDSPTVGASSRAMLLTGKRISQLPKSIYLTANDVADPVQLLPQYFRQHGYNTYAVGKWDNSRQGFVNSFDGGECLFFGDKYSTPSSGQNQALLHHFDTTGQYKADARYKGQDAPCRLFANAATNFLNTYQEKPVKGGKKPFLLYVSFTTPHESRRYSTEWLSRYEARSLRLPASFLAEHPFDTGELGSREEKTLPRPLPPNALQAELARYYASVSQLDEQIGRILQTLEETKLAANTLVVWCSPNGLSLGEHGLLSEQNLYESSIRVPLVMAGPGIRRNQRVDALCYLHDVFPTLCRLGRLPLPERLDGQSMEGLLTGKEKQHRQFVLFGYRPPMQRGVRTAEGWKLIQYRVKNQVTEQLFNLREDPLETQNLSDDRAAQVQKQKLLNLLSEEKKL